MREVTDEEILEKIAEIEGKAPCITTHEEKWETTGRKHGGWWGDKEEKEWEAEGWVYDEDSFFRDDHTDNYCWKRELPEPKVYWSWNPLTNWSDLGPLVEKYIVTLEVIPTGDDPIGPDGSAWEAIVSQPVSHESIHHAICLAIIEAHK